MTDLTDRIVVSGGVEIVCIPFWVVCSNISDRAVRMYALLNRQAANGVDDPTATCNVEELRAIRELIEIGAVVEAPGGLIVRITQPVGGAA